MQTRSTKPEIFYFLNNKNKINEVPNIVPPTPPSLLLHTGSAAAARRRHGQCRHSSTGDVFRQWCNTSRDSVDDPDRRVHSRNILCTTTNSNVNNNSTTITGADTGYLFTSLRKWGHVRPSIFATDVIIVVSGEIFRLFAVPTNLVNANFDMVISPGPIVGDHLHINYRTRNRNINIV